METLLKLLDINQTIEDLAHKGLETLLKNCKTNLDLNLTIEKLAYIGLGTHLSKKEDWERNINVQRKKDVMKIEITNMVNVGLKKNVYAADKNKGSLDSHHAEKWEVLINDSQKREFEIYKNLLHRITKKPSDYGRDFTVIKGKIDNGIWRAKNIYKKNDTWFVKAWGVTNLNPKRHKLSENEAKEVSVVLGRKIIFDSDTNTWNIVLQNIREDLVRVWMILWNQKI